MSDCIHTSNNSWWERDVKNIPLCRVCSKCEKEKLATYRPSVLSDEQQMTAFGKVVTESNYEGVEECMEADY
jgi:hypothetical protein